MKSLPRPRVILFVIAVLAAAIASGGYWLRGATRRTTENAYVNARIVQVSALVMGPIVRVAVADNQHVTKGDVLFEIDPRPFETSLRDAQAKLEQAQRGERQDLSEVSAAQADADRLAVEVANAEANYARTQDLVKRNFVSRQAADDALAKVDTARASLAAARARVQKARAATPVGNEATPAIESARAAVDRARLDLEHATVRASESGRVTNLDLATGTVVAPGTPLFAVVVDQSFWVDANFKETELGGIRPGLAATIVIDMYPDHEFHGAVESLAGGTGAAFSLLPPQNASGNWVKVAQRVPVRIRIDDPDPAFPLRVGATATVSVKIK